MARKRRSSNRAAVPAGARWTGLVLLALGFFVAIALTTYSAAAFRAAVESGAGLIPGDWIADFSEVHAGVRRGWLGGATPNLGGGLGVLAAATGLAALGWTLVWFIPLTLIAWGRNRLSNAPMRSLAIKSLVAIPLVGAIATLLAAVPPQGLGGGAIGRGLWQIIGGLVGPAGGILALVVLGFGFLALEVRLADERSKAVLRYLARAAGKFALVCGRLLRRGALGFIEWMRTAWVRNPEEEEEVEEEVVPAVRAQGRGLFGRRKAVVEPEAAEEPTHSSPLIVDRSRTAAAEEAAEAASASSQATPAAQAPAPRPVPSTPPPPGEVKVTRIPPGGPMGEEGHPLDVDPRQDVEAAVLEARRQAKAGTAEIKKARRGRMTIPGTEILDDVPETGPPVAEHELLENSRILTETLQDFGISGRVGEVHPGPVITRYEFQPGPGVKVVQINNRQDDLALKLRATRIRILAPIPGKAAVGVEVPNRSPSPIFLRRLLETKPFQDASNPLPLALGRDISGAPVITELSKMPHLLIAGTTGSGKSVCMNALITSLLLKRTPDELRLLMIDPKMIEMPMYNGIPHLLAPVVTDPKLAARSLKWLLVEMERRYRLLSRRGCRNILSYNSKMEKEGPLEEGEEKLPYIVVLIDELADLMITSGAEVEEPIARIAQTARAVGIHLIVATQRPSVDVITGVIKANFPCRIAFQVAVRHDSRTILDQNGAESLLGKGDMLFLPPGTGFPMRVHGAFVSESETQRLADAWRSQGEMEVHADLDAAMAEPETGMGGLGDDPLFADAARLVVTQGQASASMLQRRLKVGYARAARLVDMLEGAGVVSAQDGSKPRDILVDEVRLEHVLAGSPD